MAQADQIGRHMSLRQPQREGLAALEEIVAGVDLKSAALTTVAAAASEKSRAAKPIEFDTQFPSFCFSIATGVGKTRLMGACIYHLWKTKGYRHYFLLTPNITVYDKLRAELLPSHPKYMFIGLSDFPPPEIYDGDNYLRYHPEQMVIGNPATVFVFNIGKIFQPRVDTEFKFHKYNELLGDSFSALLRGMDDLVVLMDESHRYRGPKSLEAINHLKPVLGLEYTATPAYKENVIYSFSLAQAVGRFVKTPTVITRTNLTTSDEQEIERLKLLDGMTLHEKKKGLLAEYCASQDADLVKPFVLISTKDTSHASQVRAFIESDAFYEGRYRGKVLEVHSGRTGAESDENVRKLLQVESPTSTVEIVIHVNMLKEGWDVKNLYTIIPLRASISEILTEQTIGRGLRLPFVELTGDPELDSLEIVSHDQYAKLIAAARATGMFKVKALEPADLRPVQSVQVQHEFVELDKVLERISERRDILFTQELTDERRLNEVVAALVEEQAAVQERQAGAAGEGAPQALPQLAFFGDEPADAAAPRPFDPEKLAAELRDRLRRFAHANIDVPRIVTEVEPERKFTSFEPLVRVGPFELVDQHLQSYDLSTGEQRLGEKVEVMAIDEPRKFLAGRLLDAVDEWDVANDKEAALALVDSYIARIGREGEDLKRIVHLYRDVIIGDLKAQVEDHIHDESRSTVYVKSGFVTFREYTKTVLARDGILNFKERVPKSDVQRYLFEGFAKSLIYKQVPFDSAPEKEFAELLERDDLALKWIRPPEGNVPIYYRGRSYNPDFIVETADKKYLVEVKARGELLPAIDEQVRAKAEAAIRWCEAASSITATKPWEYKLIPDDVIRPSSGLAFVLSQAVRT